MPNREFYYTHLKKEKVLYLDALLYSFLHKVAQAFFWSHANVNQTKATRVECIRYVVLHAYKHED